MSTYAVFLRGSSNTRNSVGSCLWVGEAESAEAAKTEAQEEEGIIYAGQYLEADDPDNFCEEDQELIDEWHPQRS